MMTRTVACVHVQHAYQPVLPLRRTGIRLGNVTFLVEVALCANCAEDYRTAGRVQVGPLGTGHDETIPSMWIWQGSHDALVQADVVDHGDDEPDPQDARRVVVAGHVVMLYRERRLRDTEMARWAHALAMKAITARTFRMIAERITAGPNDAGSRAVEIPASDPNEGRHLQVRPHHAPSKDGARLRCDWGKPRTKIGNTATVRRTY